MGSSADGHGHVAVYGLDGGSYAAALESQPDWKGLVGAYSKEKKAVAYITESPKHPGGGNVIMADPEGNKVFTAGFIGDGDGAACVMRKGSAKCLGLDIGGILGVP